MDGNDLEIKIQVKYSKKSLVIGPSNERISIEKIIQESCKKFDIGDELKQFITLTYKDEQGDINIIMNDDDIINNLEEISPDKYILKMNLDIYPYALDNQKEEKNINKDNKVNKVNENELKIYLEENERLKKKITEITKEKDEKIKELEDKINKMEKEYFDKLNKNDYDKNLKDNNIYNVNNDNTVNINKIENIMKINENNIRKIIENELNKKENLTHELIRENNNIKNEIINIKNEIISIIKEHLEKDRKNEDNINSTLKEYINIVNDIQINLLNNKKEFKNMINKKDEKKYINKTHYEENENNINNNNLNGDIHDIINNYEEQMKKNDNKKKKIDKNFKEEQEILKMLNKYFFDENDNLISKKSTDNDLYYIKEYYKDLILKGWDIEDLQNNYIKYTVDAKLEQLEFGNKLNANMRKTKIMDLVVNLIDEIKKEEELKIKDVFKNYSKNNNK